MFLRDMLPFYNNDFVYCWEKQPFANSALLYMELGSDTMKKICRKILRIKSTQPWAVFNYADNQLADLQVYPVYFFDPLWNDVTKDPPYREFADFFKEFDETFKKDGRIQSYQDFFPNAYAYHWHNQWKHDVFENSYFGMFDREFNKILSLDE